MPKTIAKMIDKNPVRYVVTQGDKQLGFIQRVGPKSRAFVIEDHGERVYKKLGFAMLALGGKDPGPKTWMTPSEAEALIKGYGGDAKVPVFGVGIAKSPTKKKVTKKAPEVVADSVLPKVEDIKVPDVPTPKRAAKGKAKTKKEAKAETLEPVTPAETSGVQFRRVLRHGCNVVMQLLYRFEEGECKELVYRTTEGDLNHLVGEQAAKESPKPRTKTILACSEIYKDMAFQYRPEAISEGEYNLAKEEMIGG